MAQIEVRAIQHKLLSVSLCDCKDSIPPINGLKIRIDFAWKCPSCGRKCRIAEIDLGDDPANMLEYASASAWCDYENDHREWDRRVMELFENAAHVIWDEADDEGRPWVDPKWSTVVGDPCRWVDLDWNEAVRISEERTANRRADGSHRDPEDEDAGHVGVAAEMVYAIIYDYPMPTAGEPDDGTDYSYVNVKGTVYTTGKLITRESTQKWPKVFALAQIDDYNSRGRLLGWAYAHELRGAPVGTLPGREVRNHMLRQCDLRRFEMGR